MTKRGYRQLCVCNAVFELSGKFSGICTEMDMLMYRNILIYSTC